MDVSFPRTLALGVLLTIALLAGCKPKEETNAKGGAPPVAPASPSVHASWGGPALAKVPCDETYNLKPSSVAPSCLLAREYSLDGYDCAKGKLLEVSSEGKLRGCFLKAPRVIDGWSCKDGFSLYPSAKLRRCKVAEARAATEGTTVRVDDWVTLYESGSLKRLELTSGPATVQGLPCKGYFNFFHESGKLKKCELSEDATIEGKKVSSRSAGGSVFVCFDDTGKRALDCAVLGGMTLD